LVIYLTFLYFLLIAANLPPFASRKASDFSHKLSPDTQIKPYRPHLKMPAQILDEVERAQSIFVSRNGLIDDPVAFEKERALINPWTQKEKEKFMEMLCLFGKDFAKVSSFLPHKTTADCVEFYYKSHKSESFAEVRKHLSARKAVTPGNYLGSRTGKKRKRESSAVSLDELGPPSFLAVQNPNRPKSKTTSTKKVKIPDSKKKSSSSNKKRRLDSPVAADHQIKNSFFSDKKGVDLAVVGFQKVNVGYSDRAKSVNGPGCIPWTHSLEGMSSCITASPGDKEKSFDDDDDDDDCSDDGWQDVGPAWTDNEKSLFVQGLRLYGNDFERISALVGSRTGDHCKTFFSKSWRVLNLEAGFAGNENPGNGYMMADEEGAKAVSNEVCVAETESGTCSTQSCSKQEHDGFLAATTKGNDVTQVQDSEEILEITSSDKVHDVIVFGKLIKLSSCAAELCENEIRDSLGKVGLGVDGSNVDLFEEYLSDRRCSSKLEGFSNDKSKVAKMENLLVSDPVEDLEKID
jgi:Myb-like DNA-binding domain